MSEIFKSCRKCFEIFFQISEILHKISETIFKIYTVVFDFSEIILKYPNSKLVNNKRLKPAK